MFPVSSESYVDYNLVHNWYFLYIFPEDFKDSFKEFDPPAIPVESANERLTGISYFPSQDSAEAASMSFHESSSSKQVIFLFLVYLFH